MIQVRRVYDPPFPDEGIRFLVDRLWPRGIKRASLEPVIWSKEVAPSDGLRKWYGHDPKKWEEFRRRYFSELDGKAETWRPILEAVRKSNVTLLYSARETRYNNAIALKMYLEQAK